MNDSYIKVLRKLTDWEWYSDSKMVHLFIHLLISANHTKGNWRGQNIERGQLITGFHSLMKSTGIGMQSLRTCLERLKSTGEITIKSTNKYSVVTIVKYDDYQSFDKKATSKSTNKLTNEQQTTNKQLTTNNNDNNNKEVYRQFAHLKLLLSDFEKLKEIYSKDEIDSILDSIENYKKNTNYKNLFLTAKKWLQKEFPNRIKKDICPYDENQIRIAKTQKNSGGGIPSWFDLKYKEVLND